MKKKTQSQVGSFFQRCGNTIVGLLGALSALVAACLMPAHSAEILGASGLLAVFTILWHKDGEP